MTVVHWMLMMVMHWVLPTTVMILLLVVECDYLTCRQCTYFLICRMQPDMDLCQQFPQVRYPRCTAKYRTLQ
jgi:hypothetical protein